MVLVGVWGGGGDSVLVGWKFVLKTADCSQADHTQKEREREIERERKKIIKLIWMDRWAKQFD